MHFMFGAIWIMHSELYDDHCAMLGMQIKVRFSLWSLPTSDLTIAAAAACAKK